VVSQPSHARDASKFLRVSGDLSLATPGAERLQLAESETVIPDMFDLHAHSTTFVARGNRDSSSRRVRSTIRSR
jgi:hypothetical protein